MRRKSREEATAEAFVRGLFTEHGRAMLAYATRLTGDHAAAEDIVQDALLRAWRHADRLTDGKGSVRGWLLTVVRNLVYDRTRARQARPPEVGAPPPDAAVTGDHAERVVDSIVVLDALDRLSHEHRTVLELVYLRGNTVAEASRELGIPPGTVKSRTHHAIRTLRTSLPRRSAPVERTAS